MKNVKTAQKALSALIFSSTVLLTSASVVFASEQLTGPHSAMVNALEVGDSVKQVVMNMGEKFVVQKVNINLASYAQLISLPGIGRVKATAIINYRKEVGMFAALADIQKIKGIGEKLFARLQEKIMI
jgi:competence protein ComEA